ncbi:Hydrophobin [Cordyceps militaris CM01]|uniref:Class I hydrophobin 4 n=2 Tax=Cordyceps militaris TaxID=73501 RepID=HYD4_CORMI|nr:Hydrophobin [Cordyceps militaris CM01]ATY62804.1 fungal hydrophobin [Cordyceps militaris]EGX89712.1 Hydrophobin [Cordyceps militaris CM01]
MFASTVFVSLLAVAAAVPTNPQGQSCGNGNTVHCCNAETANKLTKGGILGALDLSNLLGQCNDVTAAVAGGAVPIKNTCSSQAVCCGEIHQNGLVNLGCTPIFV